MIQLFKMAFRDLGRNRRRSLFSALALGMGLGLLLFLAGVLEGEIRGSRESSIRLSSGHLQVRAQTYNEDKTSLAWQDLVQDPGKLAAQIAALPPVEAATPRLFATGIVTDTEESIGVRVMGIDPASTANAPYRDGLLEGDFFAADDRAGVLIGLPLAEKLHIGVGDQINLLVNTSNGDVDQQPFTVRGIYTTHTSSLDERVVLMPLAKAQTITRAEGYASTVFILLKEIEQTQAVAEALQTERYQVLTWEQMNELLTQIEVMYQPIMFFLYLIILAVTATVVINTLIMSVYERTREIGILSALGMRSRHIMAMFFAETGLIAVGGILMGLVIGGVMVAYATIEGFYMGNMGVTGMVIGDTIYAHLTVEDTIYLTVMAFIVTLLAGLYPALLAARMEPVEALHGGK